MKQYLVQSNFVYSYRVFASTLFLTWSTRVVYNLRMVEMVSVVFGCSKRSKRDKDVHFYRIPKVVTIKGLILKLWANGGAKAICQLSRELISQRRYWLMTGFVPDISLLASLQVFLMKLALTGFLHCIWGMEDTFLLTVVKLLRRGGKGLISLLFCASLSKLPHCFDKWSNNSQVSHYIAEKQ